MVLLGNASPAAKLKTDVEYGRIGDTGLLLDVSTPFLLIHGTADKSVPYMQSIAFQQRLRTAGVPCELVTVEGAPHRLSEWETIDPTPKDKMIARLKATLAQTEK